MNGQHELALTHLADFLAVGAHAALRYDIDSLLALGDRVRRWPEVSGPATTTAEAHQIAIYDGLAAHLLDWDDVMLGVPNHPGTVIWPALLGAASAQARIVDLTRAFAEGLGVASELSAALGRTHYERGWHATTTIGRMAAAYAAGFARYADPGLAWTAMQLSAVQASGVSDVFGTSVKPLQVGLAAGGAAHAAILAEHFRDVPDVLSPDTALGGILGVQRAPEQRESYSDPAHGDDLRVKAYPCCYYAHAPVLAAIRLHASEGPPDPSAQLVVKVSPGAARVCKVSEPRTVDEARFSIQYLVAAAAEHWADGALGLLDGSLLASNSVADGAKRIVVEVDEGMADMAATVQSPGQAVSLDLAQPDAAMSRQLVREKARQLPEPIRELISECIAEDPAKRQALLDRPASALTTPLNSNRE